MAHNPHFLLTTTPSVEGWEVIDYVGPVSAEFVIGGGLFSDFLASWADVFGARSRAYEEKLDRINEQALAMIERKAARLGANAVLGLRVDHDQVSGAGKSMLMVTASGTAARLRRTLSNTDAERADEQLNGSVALDEFRVLLRKKELIDKAAAGELNLGDEDTWRFVVEHRVEELAAYALERAERLLEGALDENRRAEIRAKYGELFLVLPSGQAKDYLYDCVGRSWQLWALAFNAIREGTLFDAERITTLLRGEDELARHRSIHLVTCDLPFYSTEEVRKLEALRAEIQTAFPEAPTYRVKGVFGEKEVWKCMCGFETKASETVCDRCGKDRRGFDEEALKPAEAMTVLEKKIDVLRVALGAT